MSFGKHHWHNPRETIAASLKDHDLAYATHGAHQAMVVLSLLKHPLHTYAKSSILDYGCGTGRIARMFHPIMGRTWAYDPVPQVITHGLTEALPMVFPKLTMTYNIADVPQVDYAFSVNVIEHLSLVDAEEMIDNLQRLVKNETVMWYSLGKNSQVLAPYLTDDQKRENDAAMRSQGKVGIQVHTISFRDQVAHRRRA